MVNVRNELDVFGLKLRIEPEEEDRPFFFTGESPKFHLILNNAGKRRRKGKLILHWQCVFVDTVRIVSFDIPAASTRKYPVEPEWLYSKGTAFYSVLLPDQMPEEFLDVSEKNLELQVRVLQKSSHIGFHTLASYEVLEKAVYEEEQRKQQKLLSALKRIEKSLR